MSESKRPDKARSQSLRLRTAEQRRAIRSPLRQELLELLDASGPCGVADLATRMGRPADRLYYHVRLLQEAGIIRPAGSRKSGKRDEILYEPAAERFEVEADGDSTDAEHLVATLRPALRRAERELGAAVRAAASDKAALERDVYAGRMRAHLTSSQRTEVRRHLREIERIFKASSVDEPPPKARAFALTLVLAAAPGP